MKLIRKLIILLLLTGLVLTACPPVENNGTEDPAPTSSANPQPTAKPLAARSLRFIQLETEGIKFPIGLPDNPEVTLDNDFGSILVAEAELNFQIWKKVRAWAIDETIDHDGNPATTNDVYSFGKGNGGYHVEDTKWSFDDNPVLNISWEDAIVFCNALTEYFNSQVSTELKLQPVFYANADYSTLLRSATNVTHTVYFYAEENSNNNIENCLADGFRIPSRNEWEMAARWYGTDNDDNDNLIPTDNKAHYWYRGSYLSGASASYNKDNANNDFVAVFWSSNNVKLNSAAIASKNPNKGGFYDMSGNGAEYTLTISSNDKPYVCGGHFSVSAEECQIGYYLEEDSFGFNYLNTLRLFKYPTLDESNQSLNTEIQEALHEIFSE